MKVYIVNKESGAVTDTYTVPLKGFKEEKEAIKYMSLCVEEILRRSEDFKLQVIDDKHKIIYVEDEYGPNGKRIWYTFYINTVEVF